MVVFEIPTGIIADTLGRRASYLLGTVTLMASTLLYVGLWQIEAPFWTWAVSSVLLGLGFTFFSGATEAWLVDALNATGFEGTLESVFGKGQVVTGVAMLTGSVAGGLIAQATNLGVPFVLRSVILGVTFVVAFVLMHDVGFTPVRSRRVVADMRAILTTSIDQGLRRPPVRWVMLAAPFTFGVGIYAFYALQPYILRLYGDEQAYSVAGLVAAAVSGAQIVGGLTAPLVRRVVRHRTSALLLGTVVGASSLIAMGVADRFPIVLGLLIVWALVFAAVTPIRQAYLNGMIPSQQRATVLSFDSLMGSSGGVVIQPVLGRVADVRSYAASFVVGGAINLIALPFLWLSRRERAPADTAR
jgi:MFS family permease